MLEFVFCFLLYGLNLKLSMVEMEWPGSLEEYSKLINRMNTPRFLSFNLLQFLLPTVATTANRSLYSSSSSVIASFSGQQSANLDVF